MNETEHLLTIVMEECTEVAQRASKALRFGLSEVQPGQELTNAQRVMVEYADLVAVIHMLQDKGAMLPGLDFHMVMAKKEKVTHFLEYSRKQGTLT